MGTRELAEEYAREKTANTQDETAKLLEQYEKIAEQQNKALDENKALTESQINAQRNDIMDNYHTNARQAYINSMLGRRTVQQQLSQAGLNTSGLVGSAYANLENAYGNNLASLQNQRDKSINDINRQLNESNMQYEIQRSNLLADLEKSKLELQKYGNELAYQRYQDALNNYLTFLNYDLSQQASSSRSSGGLRSSGGNGGIIETFEDNTNGLSQRGQELYNQYVNALRASGNSGAAGSGMYNALNNPNTAANLINRYRNELTDSDIRILTSMLGI